METIKKPEMLWSFGNTTIIVGLAIYFHKQLSALKTEYSELSEHLKSSVNKFAEVQGELISRGEMQLLLNQLHGKIEGTEKRLKNENNGDEIELLQEVLEDLSDLLNESGVKWDYPPRRRRRKTRRGKKKTKKRTYSSEESTEDSDEEESSESEVDKAITQARRRKKSGKRK